MTDIDCFIAGFCGGGIASIAIFLVYHHHLKMRFKEYFVNRRHYRTWLQVKGHGEDLDELYNMSLEMREELSRVKLDVYELMTEEKKNQ